MPAPDEFGFTSLHCCLSHPGHALHALKRFEEAQACFDIILQSDPAHLQALQHKAETFRDMKKYDEAIATINEVRTLADTRVGSNSPL